MGTRSRRHDHVDNAKLVVPILVAVVLGAFSPSLALLLVACFVAWFLLTHLDGRAALAVWRFRRRSALLLLAYVAAYLAALVGRWYIAPHVWGNRYC
jgi:hypothetical protein